MSWKALAAENPELAKYGLSRFESRVAYLATIRKDGSPRVHPVTPFVANDRLFVGMEKSSPKGWDLRREPRFAIHCAVEDDEGGMGEFSIAGTARFAESIAGLTLAKENAPYEWSDSYILFELSVEKALSKVYLENGIKRMRYSLASTGN